MGLDPVTASLIGGGMSLIGGLFSSKTKEAAPAAAAPAQPAQIPAVPESQAAKTPSPDTFKRQNANTANQGIDSTLLTGLGGVDPKLLNLGKNTLLGA